MFLAVLYFQYITTIYKPFGESKGLPDQFLTFAASFGMAFNLISRLIGGIILDNVSFKSFFSVILLMSTILGLTFDLVAHIEEAFIIYLACSYFVTGAIFVSMPIYYAKTFGPETGS